MSLIFIRNFLLRSYVTLCTIFLLAASGTSFALSALFLAIAIFSDAHVLFAKRNWAKSVELSRWKRILVFVWLPLALNFIFCLMLVFLFILVPTDMLSESITAANRNFIYWIFEDTSFHHRPGLGAQSILSEVTILWLTFLFFSSMLHARLIFHMDIKKALSSIPDKIWWPRGAKPYLTANYLGDVILQICLLAFFYFYIFSYLLYGGLSAIGFLNLFLISSACLFCILILAEYEARLVFAT